jgi:hypothetical protein
MRGVLRKRPRDTNLIQLYNTDAHTGKRQNSRQIKPADIHNEFDPEILSEILEQQEDALKEGSYRLCVIFEDCPGLDMLTGANGKIMRRLVTTLRHYQTTVLYCSQSYMLLPRTVRLNCTHMIVWNIQNIGERRRIHQEHPMVGSFDKFNTLFDALMRTSGHPFIFFNFRNPIGKQIVLNFDVIVDT